MGQFLGFNLTERLAAARACVESFCNSIFTETFKNADQL